MPPGQRVKDRYFFLDRQRRILRLLQDFDRPPPALDQGACLLVQVGTELGESLELTELRQIETERPGHLLHRLDLRG